MPKPAFDRAIDSIAHRITRKMLNERADLMLSYDDMDAITLCVARTIKDEWPKLAALRATYRPKSITQRVRQAAAEAATA